MATIRIDRNHALTHAKARAAASKLAKDLEQRFALKCTWDGDDVRFERSGVDGRMHVGNGRITLDVTLGFLLSAMKPVIEREIHSQLDKLAPAVDA
ncbi:MAG: polyhydroxyalkanoic acid system family protein [Casimicrobiaceae bacterium]